ncbi:hypothetical protein [Streptomyces sp. NPDC020681]
MNSPSQKERVGSLYTRSLPLLMMSLGALGFLIATTAIWDLAWP